MIRLAAVLLFLAPQAWSQTVGWDYYGKFYKHAISANNGAESTSAAGTLPVDFPGTPFPKGTLKIVLPNPPDNAYFATYSGSTRYQLKSPIQAWAGFDGSVAVNDSPSVLRTVEVTMSMTTLGGQVCTGPTQTISHVKGGSTIPVSVTVGCSFSTYSYSISTAVRQRTTPENDVHGSTESSEFSAGSFYEFGLPYFLPLPSVGDLKDKDSRAIVVQTGGIGTLPWQAAVTKQDGSAFPNITATPAGSALSPYPFQVAITSDPTGLAPGSYPAVITLTSPTPHVDPVKKSFLLNVTVGSDSITLGAESPPRTEKIYCGVPYDFSATASYALAQKDSADLRLYAKAGSTTYGLASQTVQKGSGQQTLKLTQVSVPCGAGGLALYAALESSGTVLAKSADIPYTMDTPLADSVSILAEFPKAGESLQVGAKSPSFFAMVGYSLGSVAQGDVYLV